MSRQNRPGGGASTRPAGTDGGPPVRRAVALPSVGDDAEQALRPAPRRGTATTSGTAGTTALSGNRTSGEAGHHETETTSADPGPAGTAAAPGEPEARARTTAPSTDRGERPEAAPDAAVPSRTSSRSGAGGALSGLAAVLGGVRRPGSAGSGDGGGDADGDGSPGRPKAPMLAAAGIAGVILIAIPLLVMAGNERDEHPEEQTTVAADSRTLSDQQETEQLPDVYVAESPKDASSSPEAGDGGKEGKTTKGGGKASPGASPSPAAAVAAGARPQKVAPLKKEVEAKSVTKKAVSQQVTVVSARIVSADTGKCLTATTRGAGSELVVQPCGSSEGAQIWSFHDEDHTLRIGQSLCMGLDGGSVQNGTAIRLQQCNGSSGQKFKINATEDLVSLKAGDKCADVWWGEGADNTPVKLWPCTGTANQTWRRG